MSITIDKDPDTAALPERIKRFPFPFTGDQYRYSANVEPAHKTVPTEAGAWGARLIDIDEFYHEELADRDEILTRDPSRMQVLPHMRPAVWDALTTVLTSAAEDYPDTMSFHREGNACGLRHSFEQGHRLWFLHEAEVRRHTVEASLQPVYAVSLFIGNDGLSQHADRQQNYRVVQRPASFHMPHQRVRQGSRI